jgi:hypothetical protein
MFEIIGQLLMTNSEFVVPTIGGAIGALIADMLDDNCISLPKIINGKLFLGFIGALCIGAFAGYAVDGSFITAAMGGYTGRKIIESLMLQKTNVSTIKSTD